jgi:hypothetical protein
MEFRIADTFTDALARLWCAKEPHKAGFILNGVAWLGQPVRWAVRQRKVIGQGAVPVSSAQDAVVPTIYR